MGYVVRTPEGELVYPSLLDVERAYVQGLVDPDDEVREETGTAWRKAASLPALAAARPPRSGVMQRGQIFKVAAVVLLSVVALSLVFRDNLQMRGLGIVLALAASTLLFQITTKAFKRAPSGG
ncbi:hypothetical protein A176_004205 [Myxococcus hansupus]|uniref:Uncharacterized protein n=1 Tax=Pseudomyxococcus hansupus TaxID=1297742 RepID=A0A0H4X088_9BACT|nr:hypothetical protein [Myxococcus hansupus]AKQ67293.1 hypothetical protein A176_004205 [Myxococcus hansupus]